MHQGPLRKAIHSLKYQNNIGLAEALSVHLVELLDRLEWRIDLVIPVPLAAQRRLERGYNQASLLALPVALSRELRYSTRALRRTRETRSQVGLSGEERHINVKDAFNADSNAVKEKSVLVIDDVATTGATQEACARALLTAGASTVYGLTLARAGFHSETAEESSSTSSDQFIL
jgi:ComF family protein